MRKIARDMGGAGAMAHQKNPIRAATIRRHVLDRPAHGGADVLDPRGPGMLGREPISDGDADQPVAGGPDADILVKRAPGLDLVAGNEAAAMYEHERRPRVGGWRVGGENVEPVALVRPVFKIAVHADAGIGLLLL